MMNGNVLSALDSNDIADKIISGEFLVCKRPGRSRVWAVYSRIVTREGLEIPEFVYCESCSRVFKYHKTSTSNLVKHKCYAKCMPMDKNVSLIEEEKIIIKAPDNPAEHLTRLLTRWIIKDCRPYNLLRDEGLLVIFQEIAKLGSKFGNDLQIGRLLPTASIIAKNVSGIYEKCFERIKSEIASIKDNGFGLTTDIWTDNWTKQSYIATTIHYLKNGVLTLRLLGLQTLEDERIKGQNVAEKVKQILDLFSCNLSSKSIIVTDEDIFKTIPNATHLPCISQLLDSALLKSVEEVPEVAEIISSCSKLVVHLKKVGLSTVLGALSHNFYPNRWILIYKMLQSIENNWNEIVKTLESRNEGENYLTIDINFLKAITKTFQPLEEAIETLEDDSCATLHLVLVFLHELRKSCDTNDNEFRDFDFIENLKKNLQIKIDRIVTENITTLHKLALFLFPPTNKLLQFTDTEKKAVDNECIRLMKCFKNENKSNVKVEPEQPMNSVSKHRKLFSDFVESEATRDPNELIMQELQYYKNTRVTNIGDFDMFGWWELQKDNFPLLYKLSCTVLATPATSAASKRVFSAASSLLCENSYQGIKDTEAEKIMFINSNSEHDEIDSYFLRLEI